MDERTDKFSNRSCDRDHYKKWDSWDSWNETLNYYNKSFLAIFSTIVKSFHVSRNRNGILQIKIKLVLTVHSPNEAGIQKEPTECILTVCAA